MKILLVTVTFNSAKTLRDMIYSVLSQSYTDIKYIAVDGLSNDETVALIKEYEPLFQGRLKWISEKDKGPYDAMNKGIRMSTRNTVGIINSDDFHHREDVLEKVAQSFRVGGTEAIYGDVCFVNPNNLDKTVRYYLSKRLAPPLFRFGFMPAHPTFFIYRRYFDLPGYYRINYKIATDYELLVRFLYIHRLRSKYSPLDLMKMRIEGASTASIKSNILLSKEIVRTCKGNGIWTCYLLLSLKYPIEVFELILIKKWIYLFLEFTVL